MQDFFFDKMTPLQTYAYGITRDDCSWSKAEPKSQVTSHGVRSQMDVCGAQWNTTMWSLAEPQYIHLLRVRGAFLDSVVRQSATKLVSNGEIELQPSKLRALVSNDAVEKRTAG